MLCVMYNDDDYTKSFQSSTVFFASLLYLHRSKMVQTCESMGLVSRCSGVSSKLVHLR